ncbi:uncharacterized protein MONOS_894 [Monocercomonoides exilis]|uniref:uncharacterized protein n=1 Tax=Monocercomonoides exilis TaxID=2049356 RepID=UPI00355A07FD|nr:hypothetical protein MONOS_894 [Monocercomonoides exilis]|eukprot:MONOS_894.1-p1 / transcript=MONOS_894.1 / gene=MONOS_894 / organism=Monocercomonoides_exilis_PA203 / gene_product=unspecified product / transcript_product=unspecified product / location=Mono_scaffold00015:5719-8319(-) / protein_length=758 / sequence_SO=supercontig / SO=protein_coding / is_pseudo=false
MDTELSRLTHGGRMTTAPRMTMRRQTQDLFSRQTFAEPKSRMTLLTNVTRATTAGRFTSLSGSSKGSSENKSTFSENCQFILRFVKEQQMKIASKEPNVLKESDLQVMNMKEFYEIFERIVQISLDPLFSIAIEKPGQKQPEKRTGNQSGKSAQVDIRKQAFLNILNLLKYPDLKAVESQLSVSRSALPDYGLAGKATFIKALAFLVEIGNFVREDEEFEVEQKTQTGCVARTTSFLALTPKTPRMRRNSTIQPFGNSSSSSGSLPPFLDDWKFEDDSDELCSAELFFKITAEAFCVEKDLQAKEAGQNQKQLKGLNPHVEATVHEMAEKKKISIKEKKKTIDSEINELNKEKEDLHAYEINIRSKEEQVKETETFIAQIDAVIEELSKQKDQMQHLCIESDREKSLLMEKIAKITAECAEAQNEIDLQKFSREDVADMVRTIQLLNTEHQRAMADRFETEGRVRQKKGECDVLRKEIEESIASINMMMEELMMVPSSGEKSGGFDLLLMMQNVDSALNQKMSHSEDRDQDKSIISSSAAAASASSLPSIEGLQKQDESSTQSTGLSFTQKLKHIEEITTKLIAEESAEIPILQTRIKEAQVDEGSMRIQLKKKSTEIETFKKTAQENEEHVKKTETVQENEIKEKQQYLSKKKLETEQLEEEVSKERRQLEEELQQALVDDGIVTQQLSDSKQMQKNTIGQLLSFMNILQIEMKQRVQGAIAKMKAYRDFRDKIQKNNLDHPIQQVISIEDEIFGE